LKGRVGDVHEEGHALQVFSLTASSRARTAIYWRLKGYAELLREFTDTAGALARGARVFEPGCGELSLASYVRAMTKRAGACVIDYVGIDPCLDLDRAEGKLSARDCSTAALSLVASSFLEWKGDEACFDLALIRFTVHHFPDQLDAWYGHIARHLRKGGMLLMADHILPDCSEESARLKDEWFGLLESATAVERTEEESEWLRHAYRDWDLFLPLANHRKALERTGFSVEVRCHYRDQAVLLATKL